jgi:hypothetical protein
VVQVQDIGNTLEAKAGVKRPVKNQKVFLTGSPAVAGPLSGPACCCDVAYLYQAFSQPTGPGRLWISLVAISLPDIQFGDARIKT